MRNFLVILLSLVLLSSCGEKKTPKQLAEEHLAKAQQLLEHENFTDAKLQIDSIKVLYPNQKQAINKGIVLLNTVELEEQRKSLVFLDSVMNSRKDQFENLKKEFVLTEGSMARNSGRYVHKRQQVKNSYDRTFIKAYLDEEGTFYITSKYAGASYIYHNSIKVYNEGLFAETNEVPEDGIDNRRYEDGGMKWETVNYRNGADNGVVSFIINNVDKPLKVQFKGKKYYYIVMEKFDKEAVRDAYLLSQLLLENKRLKTDVADTKKRIAELEKEMEEINELQNE